MAEIDGVTVSSVDQFKEDWKDNHLILEAIFKNLDLKDLKSASLVCSSWCWASAKFLSAKSLVYFLDIPSRSIEQFLKIQEECRIWEGPVRLKRFEFLSETRISKWLLMSPSADYFGNQITELTITQGKASDVNLLTTKICQKLPNLKSLVLRCSYSGLRDHNNEGWADTLELQDQDSALGLVHEKLQVLQMDLSEHCGIRWDFLQVFVGLRALSIKLLDCSRDQEPVVVHKIQEITSSLKSRANAVDFQALEVEMPIPASRLTATAVHDLLEFLQPSTYLLNLLNNGENRSPLSIVQNILEPPSSVTNFKLELPISSPESLEASGIIQAYDAIVKRRKLGFLLRLNLMYQIELSSDPLNRFVEIDTGRTEGLHLRIGSSVDFSKADQMILDWIQKLLSIVYPRHDRIYLFRYNNEGIRQVADWRMFLFNDASGVASSLKLEELRWHKLGGSKAKHGAAFERLKHQLRGSGCNFTPFLKNRCNSFDSNNNADCPKYVFLLCPASFDLGL